MNKRQEAAKKLRPLYQQGAQTFTDADALKVKGIYESWEALVEQNATKDKGYIFRYGDRLYRVEQPAYTFVSHYIPGSDGTESLFSVIDEEHSGTYDDPIPYDGNMTLEQGKYYSQDGVVYLCTRDTVNPVYAALAELVGLYVECEQ